MEYWDAYDRAGRKTGQTLLRGAPLPRDVYHLVSCVVVRHADGDFLILRRSAQKQTCPNILEIGVGGCALRGEDARTCAVRELYEETGIVSVELTQTGRYVDDRSQTIYEGFFCLTDIPKDRIRLAPEENSAYYWYTTQQFLDFFRSDQCLDRFKRRLKDFVQELVDNN